jgi:hypothetical protein
MAANDLRDGGESLAQWVGSGGGICMSTVPNNKSCTSKRHAPTILYQNRSNIMIEKCGSRVIGISVDWTCTLGPNKSKDFKTVMRRNIVLTVHCVVGNITVNAEKNSFQQRTQKVRNNSSMD